MISFKALLIEQLSRYDDDAFTALANKGLLRRAYKDLEKYSITILEESDSLLSIQFIDYTITFTTASLNTAKCSCKAGSICQHILSVAIALLRSDSASPLNDNADQTAVAKPHVTESSEISDTLRKDDIGENSEQCHELHNALAAMKMSDLVKYSGKVGYSWAWRFVNDLDIQKDTSVTSKQYIVITILRPRITFRYMGGSLDNMVADIELKDSRKYIVAAVLIYKLANGLEVSMPVEPEKALKTQLDLGKDFASGEHEVLTRLKSRIRLLNKTQDLLSECTKLGLSHLSESIHERFVTLSVWATGAELFRLSLLLRRIADHVEQLIDRLGSADEQRLFTELSIAYALTESIASYADKAAIPSSLTGIARRHYDAIGVIELIPVSAFPWRTPSGYTGFTLLMWSNDEKSFCVYTDARPEDRLRGFNPAVCYTSSVWNILPISSSIGHTITLSGAMISSDGRISSSDTVNGIRGEMLCSSAILNCLNIYDSWELLYKDHIRDSLSILSFSDPMKNYAAIRPSKIGHPIFDKINQSFRCSAQDIHGSNLYFELQYTSLNAAAIEFLEHRLLHLAERSVFIVKLVHSGNRITLEPLSIISENRIKAEDVIECIYFDAVSVRIPKHQVTKSSAHTANQFNDNDPDSFLSIPQLTDFSHLLQNIAEHGVSDESLHIGHKQIESLCRKISDNGFTTFLSILNNDFNAGTLLKLRYVLLQLEKIAACGGAINKSI